jgi:peroxiredoxin
VEEKKEVVIGQTVQDFELQDIEGEQHRLSQYRGSVVLIVFWSAECPVSQKYDEYFTQLLERHAQDPLTILGIDSNVHYGREEIIEAARDRRVNFPLLRDADARIADRFGALTTPHVYIIDRNGKLAYEGAVDDHTFRQPEPTVNYVDKALEAMLAGETPPVVQTQSYGCTIVRHK